MWYTNKALCLLFTLPSEGRIVLQVLLLMSCIVVVKK